MTRVSSEFLLTCYIYAHENYLEAICQTEFIQISYCTVFQGDATLWLFQHLCLLRALLVGGKEQTLVN